MAIFTIHVARPDGTPDFLFYDNQTSSLTWGNGESVVPLEAAKGWREAVAVSKDSPGKKRDIKKLKISLGLSCNYECSYCSQRFIPHADSSNPDDIEPFLKQLQENIKEAPEKIEFWGGEPFVYWKTLKPLAERVRKIYPDAELLIITNGSLLDPEKNEWLDKMGFSVGISHDGPGYHVRGDDPLDDPVKFSNILDLLHRLAPKGRVSFNAMVNSKNQSRAEIQKWLQDRFGGAVPIGEGGFIDPYDEGGLASTFSDAQEHILFRQQSFHEIRRGWTNNFGVTRQKINDFINSVKYQRPASTVGQKCGMDRPDNMAVDLFGNVLTCQNVSKAATAPNGQSHHIGHLTDLPSVEMKTATHWSKRKDCPDCPVLQVCKGSCMFLDGKYWEVGCDSSYSDNIPFFAAGIELMTGCVPYYIDGVREDRRDIFGKVNGIPEKKTKKTIPIMAA